jgi:hypothetical protein
MTTFRVLLGLTIGLFILLVVPSAAYPHEGHLDSYGCHYAPDRKDYHCHQGAFKGGSFGSKTEMIRLLKLQFLNLGQPWPYGEIVEEDITSPQIATQP